MKALAHERRRFGYRRIHLLLKREGHREGCRFQDRHGVAWNTEDPTSSRDDIIDIARALVRRERRTATRSAPAYA